MDSFDFMSLSEQVPKHRHAYCNSYFSPEETPQYYNQFYEQSDEPSDEQPSPEHDSNNHTTPQDIPEGDANPKEPLFYT